MVAAAQTTGKRGRLRPVRLASMDVTSETGPDGAIYVRPTEALEAYPTRLTERLEHWAKAAPERVFLAQRDAGGRWQELRYGEALERVRSLGQALLDRGLSPDRPLVILSGNDLDHGMLALAALHVGVPYAPISPAYSLVAEDHGRLRAIIDTLAPGMIFVTDATGFRGALEAVARPGIEIVAARPAAGATPLASFFATTPGLGVERAAAAVGPDTVAKFLYTSGSTGRPKAVINTQRMLCSNQQMIRQCFAFMQDEPPVILDWSPWHHTAGGNHNFGLTLYNGGSFYLDDGRPMPAGIGATIRNLTEVAPTWYFNVPKGYEAMLPHLESDAALRKNFFSRVRMLYVAGAGLGQRIWDEYDRLAAETTGGERILFGGGLGATETSPFALACTWEQDHAANCGLPAPGVELKLAPVEGKYEGRVKGPNVTPGYWKEPALSAAAFDEEGFYRLGDALKPADPGDIRKGVLFDGRIAENFKLATGTWVNVGALRAAFVNHCTPFASDAAVVGLNREFLAALIFANLGACRELAGLPASASAAETTAHPKVRERFRALLASFAAAATGSSNRIEKAILLDTPPSLAAGEITDKGSLNQRAVLERREELVAMLYDDPDNPNVLSAGKTRR